MHRIILAFIAICLSASSAWAATYYLSPTGNDSAAGTIGAPWLTPQHAANTMVAGDTTIMLNGTYVTGLVLFNRSGTLGNPITLTAQNKWQAIISSTSNCTPGIDVQASYITLSNFRIALDPSNVDCQVYTAGSTSIRGYGGTNNPNPCAPNSSFVGLRVDGLDIDISNARPPRQGNPNNVGARSLGMKTLQDNSTFNGNTIYGSMEASTNNNWVVSNNISFGGYSTSAEEQINMKAGARNAQIFNNVVHCTLPGEGGNMCVALGGHSSGYWWDSVQANGYISGGLLTIIPGGIITGCTDSTNGISVGSVVTQLENFGVPANVQVTSFGTGSGGTGTYHLSNSGFSLGSSGAPVTFTISHTNTEAYNGAAWDNVISNESGQTSAAGMVGCQNCTFSNNVMLGGEQLAFFEGSEGTAFSPDPLVTNPRVINNIWYGNGGAATGPFGFNYYTGTLTIDHNDFYNYTGLPTQTNGITSNPNFLNPASDWHLQTGSPAIAAGTTVTANAYGGGTINVSLDYSGVARTPPWDMGIYVSGGGGGGVTASLLVNGSSSATITSGASVSLTWSSTGASSCTGTGFSTGGATSDGSPVIVSPAVTTTYSITCTNGASNGSSNVTVTVVAGHLWYVDNSVGSNGAGTSWASPWKDVTNIVWSGAGVNPGDTIYISGGSTSQTYTNQIVPTIGGSAGNPITITKGIDAGHTGQVIFDGGSQAGFFPIEIGAVNDFIIQNMTCQNSGDACVWVNATSADTTIIQNMTIHTGVGPTNGEAWGIRIQNNTGAVNVIGGTIDTPASTTTAATTAGISIQGNTGLVTVDGAQIFENNVSNGQGAGGQGNDCINSYITGNTIIRNVFCSHPNGGANNLGFNFDSMVTGTSLLIYNNVIYMPVGDAPANNFSMSTGGHTGTMSYYNNTIYGNGASDLMDIATAGATMENNIFYQAGSGSGINTTAAITSDYNLIYAPSGKVGIISGVNKTWAAWQTAGNDTHGVNSDPKFTTIANAAGGFALQATSPALDVGTTLAQVPTDYLGVTRPQGTAYDMGAFELVVGGGGGGGSIPTFLLLGLGH